MIQANKAVRAAIYLRVSTRSQEDNFSLSSQEKNCRDYAERQGYAVGEDRVFVDVASGFTLERPQLKQLCAALKRGDIDAVVVNAFDRLASVDKDMYRLYGDLEDGHAALESVTQGRFDDTPTGRLVMMAYSLGRQIWKEDHVERTVRGRREKAERGHVVGMGRPPYGYAFETEITPRGKPRVIGLQPNPLTVPIVERIFTELRRRSVADVAGILNAEGVPAPRAHHWTADVVYDIGRHSVYMGEWRYGRNHRKIAADDPSLIVVPVPALVSRDAWDTVQRALSERRTALRGRMTGEADAYILRSRLVCGHCGGQLHTNPNNGRYYRCGCRYESHALPRGKPPCVLPDVRAEGIEGELWRVLAATLLDPAYLAKGLEESTAANAKADANRAETLAGIDRQLTKLRRDLDQLLTDFLDADTGPATKAAIKAHTQRIEKTIAGLTQDRERAAAVRGDDGVSVDEAEAIVAFAGEIAHGFDLATTAERRQIIELLDVRGRVYLDPARGIPLSRTKKNRFRIEWTARIPLVNTATQFNNWVIHKIADAGVIGTLKRSVSGIDDALWNRLPGLAPGQAVVSFGSMPRPLLVAVDPAAAKLRMVD